MLDKLLDWLFERRIAKLERENDNLTREVLELALKRWKMSRSEADFETWYLAEREVDTQEIIDLYYQTQV